MCYTTFCTDKQNVREHSIFRILLFQKIQSQEELSHPIHAANGYQDEQSLSLLNTFSYFKQQIAFLKEKNYILFFSRIEIPH